MLADQAHDLITELRDPATPPVRVEAIQEQLIREHQGLVHHFIHVQDSDLREDLVQVGNIGLYHAIKNFDLDRNTAFSTYAGTRIRGEISHFLRDHKQVVRIPRALQENSRTVNASVETLTIQFERAPTVREISEHTGLDTGSILEALESVNVMDMKSLSEPETWDWAPTEDRGFNAAEAWATLVPALDLLSESDRQLIGMRFVEGLNQSEIARITGLHPVAVSRRISQILIDLRRDTGELS